MITVAAAVAHCAIRQQFTALAVVAWTLAWAVLFSAYTIMHHPPYSLMRSATGAALGVTAGVVTAVIVIPWRKQPTRDWHWARMVWWLGRGVFGVGIACLLMYALIISVYLGG
jgi:drug/metabolite transporter (DMT)-like permease